MLVHLSGAMSAQTQHSKASDALDSALKIAEDAHGAEDAALVPILHARAACMERAGAELAKAAAELARARQIRRKAFGENSMENAFAAVKLASLLVKGAQEAGCLAGRCTMLVEKAVGLALEACSVACARQEHGQGGELVSEILAALDSEQLLANRAAVAQMQRLKDAYLEAVGEEWEPRRRRQAIAQAPVRTTVAEAPQSRSATAELAPPPVGSGSSWFSSTRRSLEENPTWRSLDAPK